MERGPLVHGWAEQRWTLARVKTLIGRLFHVSYTMEGTWRLLKRHGWSWQQPTRRAIERDDAAVELWKQEVWPRVRAVRRRVTAGSSSRMRPASRGRRRALEPGADRPDPGRPGSRPGLRTGVDGGYDLLQAGRAVPADLRHPRVPRA
ncbi:winged helix-turn-helix domain-containing protein [Streptomyces massasporeus]